MCILVAHSPVEAYIQSLTPIREHFTTGKLCQYHLIARASTLVYSIDVVINRACMLVAHILVDAYKGRGISDFADIQLSVANKQPHFLP